MCFFSACVRFPLESLRRVFDFFSDVEMTDTDLHRVRRSVIDFMYVYMYAMKTSRCPYRNNFLRAIAFAY